MATPETHNKNGPDSYQESILLQVLSIWPEFKEFVDEIEMIYAGFHMEFNLIFRSIEGVREQIQQAYNNGKRHFMFECMGEAFPKETIEYIHEILEPINIDAKFYFLTGTIDGIEVYKRFCDENNCKELLDIHCCWYFEFTTSIPYKTWAPIWYDVKLRPKNYLCFNKVYRQHRIDLLEKLMEVEVVNNKCYYSFQDYSMDSWDNLVNLNDSYFPYIKSNLEFVETLQLNFEPERNNPVDIRINDIKLFDDTYFSVVTETVFYDDKYMFHQGKNHVAPVMSCMFLTEKVTKPIAMMHPFILVTRPYALETLRKRGYKTFSPYIDETYDTIVDDDLRMQHIVNEVKRLSKQSNSEWLTWCENIKEIVEYNRELFFNHTSFSA